MVKLHFDAKMEAIDWKATYPHPLDLAEFLWNTKPEEFTFELVCEFASLDRDSYEMMIGYLINGKYVSDHLKVKLFDILRAGPPRKAVKTKRDNKLRMIARLLVSHYDLQLTRGALTEDECAASILEKLFEDLTEGSIRKILRAQK